MTLATSSSRSPEFFGRVPLLLSEQERFAAALDSLRGLCSALEVGVSALPEQLDPPQLVEELDHVLRHHLESAEEWLAMVAARRRDLLPAVVDIRADHDALSQALADLRQLADDPARWVELPLRITGLLTTVEAHRQVEAVLAHDAVRADASLG